MNMIAMIAPVSSLRQRLVEDITVRRFSHATQRNYIRVIHVLLGHSKLETTAF